MSARAEVMRYLRDHIVGAMHVGQLHGGDRLPSIRETANQLGKNPRTIKAAYAALEHEGLVEVRGRSGVFVARQEALGETSEETARWLSSVVVEAWRRRVAVHALPQLVQRFTAARRVSCALVEEIEDGIVAFRHELETDFGFDVRVVSPETLDAAGDVDFYAATSFYASSIRAAVAARGKPLVVLTVHPALQAAVRRHVSEGCLTVIAVDRRFAERMRVIYSPDDPSRIRAVLADDRQAIARLDPDEPVLFTRAARGKTAAVGVPLVFPHSPTLSPETVQALANVLVRRNAEATRLTTN